MLISVKVNRMNEEHLKIFGTITNHVQTISCKKKGSYQKLSKLVELLQLRAYTRYNPTSFAKKSRGANKIQRHRIWDNLYI